MASEKLRQREVHKYYQSWLDSSLGLSSNSSKSLSPRDADHSNINLSKDKALIAFAQLGCLKLDVKRCIVTLIATNQQYILAEATKSLSLVSGDGDSTRQDQIWFGNASLPRSQGISGDALTPPDYTAIGDDASSYTAPALVVNDITAHHVYGLRSYAGQGVTFYGGVPILTESGLPIGVYTVTDDKPRNGLTPGELRFMHDMAATVMHHLEIVSNQAARFRGETMVLGLGNFISGASNDTSMLDPRLDRSDQSALDFVADSRMRVFKGMNITTASPANLKSVQEVGSHKSLNVTTHTAVSSSLSQASQSPTLTSSQAYPSMAPDHGLQERQTRSQQVSVQTSDQSLLATRPELAFDSIFSRAARVLQACMSADGVLFFNISSPNATKPHPTPPSDLRTKDNHAHVPPLQQSSKLSLDRSPTSDSTEAVHSLSSDVSGESDSGSTSGHRRRTCRLLGCAFGESSHSSSHTEVPANIRLKERTLNRLITLYPQGKLFTSHVGSSTSGSDGEPVVEDVSGESDAVTPNKASATKRLRRLPRAVADELDRLVCHAQNVVWLPLWDFTRQRWSAGLFLWSKRVDRLIAAQEDLIYLKAFANSIMVEVARRDATVADTAKSTFIANISHELRTPLHGIMGNLDILQDTGMDGFQQSLVTAIEVCGRTLSDTIDHVLDYSKINQISKQKRNRAQTSSTTLPHQGYVSAHDTTASPSEEDFDLAMIVEEAVEAAYASHTFQSTGRTKLRAPSITGEQAAVDDLASTNRLRDVRIILHLEHKKSWWVRSQPSAIRRVVTNLFGNALKYTDSGMIQVTLSSRGSPQVDSTASNMKVLLSIRDTGRGMSADFVRDRAFVPFSQESQFSTGTGLGLSIVQQIVRTLGGEVELESEQGVGTELKVWLNLPVAAAESGQLHQDKTLHLTLSSDKTSGKSMRILSEEIIGPDHVARGFISATSSLALMAEAWFGIDIDEQKSHDSADFVLYMTPPTLKDLQEAQRSFANRSHVRLIIVTTNVIEKASLVVEFSEISRQTGLHIDVVSQPLGPFKFKRTIPTRMSRFQEGQTVTRLERCGEDTEMLDSANLSIEEDSAPPGQRIEGDKNDYVAESLDSTIHDNSGDNRKRSRPSLEQMTSEAPPVKRIEADTQSQISNSAIKRSADTEPETRSGLYPQPLALSVSSPKSTPSSEAIAGTASVTLIEERLRVLLVDDNDINLNLLKTCMKRAHIPFDFASDGLQATLAFENASNSHTPFSHVLMDISMPIMDGIQATREIRDFERRQNSISRVPSRTTGSASTVAQPISPVAEDIDTNLGSQRAIIMALSGVAAEATQLEMIEAGADLFLTKPVKMKELVSMLKS